MASGARRQRLPSRAGLLGRLPPFSRSMVAIFSKSTSENAISGRWPDVRQRQSRAPERSGAFFFCQFSSDSPLTVADQRGPTPPTSQVAIERKRFLSVAGVLQ
jgi:hypothetical protein